MKKMLLVLTLLLQFTLVGCERNTEKHVDAVKEDEAYLEQHNKMSAEETVESLNDLKGMAIDVNANLKTNN